MLRMSTVLAPLFLACACATEPVAPDPVPEAPANPEIADDPTDSVEAAPPAEPVDPLCVWDSDEGRRGTSNDGAWRIKYRSVPAAVPLNDEFGLEAVVFDSEGGRPDEVELAVDAAMPHHRHGMLQVPVVEQRPDGVFTVEGMLFHMPGYWELYFDVTVDGITERTQFVVELD